VARPRHPMVPALLLMLAVVLAIVALALVSTFASS
jgi:hypothetical protein